MAGRGRGMTIPAWMSQQQGAGLALPAAAAETKPTVLPSAPSSLPTQAPPSVAPVQENPSDGPAPATPATSTPQTILQAPPIMTLPPHTTPQAAPSQVATPSPMVPPLMPPHFAPPQMIGTPFGPFGMVPVPGIYPGVGSAPVTSAINRTPSPIVFGAARPPIVPHSPAAIQPPPSVQPKDDPSHWTTHKAADGRKYYYNRAVGVSTYEKPDCLKTASEKAIQPCLWKEYKSNDGRIYYSDGKESRWEMPPEYKQWKAQVEALESSTKDTPATQTPTQPDSIQQPTTYQPSHPQPQQQPAPQKPLIQFGLSSTSSMAHSTPQPVQQPPTQAPFGTVVPVVESQSSNNVQMDVTASSESQPKSMPEEKSLPQYKDEKEARTAFNEMLTDLEISATAKWKDVTDICKEDARWEALKTTGQKKQALAEYQNAKAKQEKQEKRQRARKARDNFLKMLAENTEIDHRTSWRDAKEILSDQARFKAVEEEREREDLFNDFVQELARKEKQDRRAAREAAEAVFAEMVKQKQDITFQSVWSEHREYFGNLEDPRLQVLGDGDMRSVFQKYVYELEEVERERKRLEMEAKRADERKHRKEFREYLERLVLDDEEVGVNMRWSTFREKYGTDNPLLAKLEEHGGQHARDVFTDFVDDLKLQLRDDLRDTRDALRALKVNVEHDTSFEGFAKLLFQDDLPNRNSNPDRKPNPAIEQNDVTSAEHKDDANNEVENHEPRENSRGDKGSRPRLSPLELVGVMYVTRPRNFRLVYEDLLAQAKKQYAEVLKKQEKKEGRFKDLLDEYFYRSDHIGISWDEAKKELQDRSAYDAVDRSTRKRLFHEHMEELAEKMAKRTKAAQERLQSRGSSSSNSRSPSSRRSSSSHSPDRPSKFEKKRNAPSSSRSPSQPIRGRSPAPSSSPTPTKPINDKGQDKGNDKDLVPYSLTDEELEAGEVEDEQVKAAKTGREEGEDSDDEPRVRVKEHSEEEEEGGHGHKKKKKKHKHEKKSKKHKRSESGRKKSRSRSPDAKRRRT